MKTLYQFIMLALCLLLFNCSKDSADDPVIPTPKPQAMETLSGANQLTSFSILAAANSNLGIDADVQQNGSNYKIYVPANTDLSNLIPTFAVSAKAKLAINGTVVASGSSTVDLSHTSTLTVTAENGDTNELTLSAESNFTTLDTAIEALRVKYNAPGFQVAITRNERLVYQNHYGFADLAGQEAITDASVFRLASVSKTITAISILKMAEDGLFNLDDTVFGTNGILENDFGTAPYGTNIENITVRHLLEHESGWTNSPNDPLFANFDWTHAQIIDDILDNRPLTTVPGSTYSYSNFGYILLGRIVEKVSGQAYEDYVKAQVLSPAGISNMNVAGNTLADKHPNEVEYFSQGDNLGPYEYKANRCDAMGGWTANATDLAKYLVAIDRNSGKADILSSATLSEMYFGQVQWGFAGSLPGTSAYIWRLDDETNFVILTNTRTIPVNDILLDMTQAMTDHIWARNSWPNYDLF